MELTAAHGSYNASNRNDLSRSCSCTGAAMQASAVGRLPALNASTESGSEIEVWRTVQRKMTDSVVVTGAGAWNCLAVTADCGVAAWRLTPLQNPSATALRTLIDTVTAIFESLLSVGDEKKIANAMLIHTVMAKVDPVTRSKWEESLDYKAIPLWKDCEAALNKRYQHLSAEASTVGRSKPNKSDQFVLNLTIRCCIAMQQSQVFPSHTLNNPQVLSKQFTPHPPITQWHRKLNKSFWLPLLLALKATHANNNQLECT
ncbi:hypothetical protein ACLKA6_018884 [Drosophila palustris]